MGMYQTSRPMIVDAVQCDEPKMIATDLGFINVKRGEWVVCGEGGECYVVDDAFFQRTFVSLRSNSQIKLDKSHVRSDRAALPAACPQRERVRLKSHSIRRRNTSGSQ